MVAGSTKGVDGCMFRVEMNFIKVIAHLEKHTPEILYRGVVAGSYGVLQRVTSIGHLFWVMNSERNATLAMVPCFRCASINGVT